MLLDIGANTGQDAKEMRVLGYRQKIVSFEPLKAAFAALEIRKLDSVFHLFCDEEDSVMVKVDTQGYEKKVLEGAAESLEKIKIVQMEMSLVPMYENETLFVDMINYLDDKGFALVSLENGWAHPRSGRLLQVDGIFLKRSIANEI
ncbi:MAG: FkbM family methyltransferase [Lewinellaceae bacterium]|nr:FkbM family methyltransferase [Lewinellaceae bacterium]